MTMIKDLLAQVDDRITVLGTLTVVTSTLASLVVLLVG